MVTCQGNASKLGGTFAKIGKTLINGLASAAISAAVSVIISKLSEVIDKLVVTRKEAESLSKQFDTTFSSMVSEQAKTASTIANIQEEYEELSDGVSALGENISLTDEQFERYHEITRIIADNIPELIQGYDDQGEAIIRLKNNVTDLTDAYKESQEMAALDLYTQTDDNGNVIEGVYKKAAYDIGEQQSDILAKQQVYAPFVTDPDKENYVSNISQQLKVQKQLSEASHEQLVELYNTSAYARSVLEGLKKEGYDALSEDADDISKLHTRLEKDAAELEVTLESDAKRVAQAGLTYAQAYRGYYTDLTSEEQKYVTAVMNSMDFEYIYENGLFDQDEMEEYVTKLVNKFKKLSSKDLETIKIGLDISTKWNNDELTYDEYVQKITEFSAMLEQLFPGDEEIQKAIRVVFDIPEPEELQQKTDNIVNRRTRVISQSQNNGANSLGGRVPLGQDVIQPPTSKQLEKSQEVYTEWLSTAKDDVRDFVESVSDEELLLTAKFDEPEDFDEWLANLQKTADENPVEVKVTYESDQTKALDDLDSAFDDDLDTAYTASQSGQTVSASELQAVNDAFGGTTFNAEDNINSLSTAIESYNQTLSRTDVTATQAQTATDQLVTAYIDQSNVLDDLLNSLDDLDEAQVQYVKDQLTAQGVTNADEVVESRLTKAYQKANTALKNVATTLTKYNKILKAGDTTADEYDTAMKSMIDNTREMIGVYDEAGNFSDELTPELNADFILTNLELIERATAGDVTAIQELRAEAAKQIQIDIDLNDKAVYQAHNDLIDLVAGLDASSFSIDGFMDNSAAYSAMAALISQAGYTAAQVKSIISAASGGTITADVGYDYVTTDVPSVYVPNEANDNAKQTGVITYKATKVKVPKFTFKYNEKASSSGAGATYGGGGGGSSSGSGGGGGGDSGSSDNKKTEDDEETYDWIEVYIQRLEEELDRLDEIVDSTYTSWSKRNNTLKKELKNLNSQIEANNTAYDNYISKANSIQVNDGKTKVNDDDYGDNDSEQKTYDQGQLDTAISEWATGKYQKLIQEGKLGTDAIEKIQNTYLKNTIEAYKEWFF